MVPQEVSAKNPSHQYERLAKRRWALAETAGVNEADTGGFLVQQSMEVLRPVKSGNPLGTWVGQGRPGSLKAQAQKYGDQRDVRVWACVRWTAPCLLA